MMEMAGLAQKGGRGPYPLPDLAKNPDVTSAPFVSRPAKRDALIGGDLVVSAGCKDTGS